MRIRIFFFSLAILGFSSCEPENPPAPIIPPQVSTLEATEITTNSAIVGGKIIEVGTEPITRQGVCYIKAVTNTPEEFTNTWPNISNNVIEASDLSETFTVVMDNLSPNQTYYVRAFAESAAGLRYGTSIKFTTEFETITDIDGNVYRIWTIGNQTWTIDNFNATRLRDGSPIPNRLEDSYWAEFAPQEPAMCWYNNDRATHEKDYGALYNWYAASHPLIAPEGWRVPTIYDYQDLAFYLLATYGEITPGLPWSVGGYCKMPGNNFWEAPNTGADKEFVFG
ncbi:MAG: hypothetical protein K0B09_12520 [Bacteroidales bacterium]|nr:hypothetical protein [Bacteroidales bacterium]